MTKEEIAKIFREKGKTLGCAESFTGGLFASEIVSIPGASHFFKGGFVTYATEEKKRVLGIGYADLDKYGVVSQETAGAMASHAKSLLGVDYCVAFTGNAGPDVMENKPVGEVYIAVAFDRCVRVYQYNFNGTRSEIRNQAVETAYEILFSTISQFN
ncbi:MAG: CinA family protein [Bacilli bacterium]|nr:CinA family protein [Bacilli bacterium]